MCKSIPCLKSIEILIQHLSRLLVFFEFFSIILFTPPPRSFFQACSSWRLGSAGYPLQATPALWLSSGLSAALSLTVELVSFPACSVCGPPGSVCRRMGCRPAFLSPVDKSTDVRQIRFRFTRPRSCSDSRTRLNADRRRFICQSASFVTAP